MTAAVSPTPVWDLINGFSAYQALRTALDLGVFDALAEGPLDAAGTCAAVGASATAPISVLLDTLVALGVLDALGPDRYSLTEVARRHLLVDAPASMATLVRHSPGPGSAWPALPQSLRAGAPPAATAADLAGFYPELAEATGPTQSAVAAAVGADLSGRGLRPAGGTVVDLGCGSGAWLCALLAGDAAARGVGVELAEVLPVARRRADAAGLADRVQLLAGDYVDAPLPVPRADVVVLAHVLRTEPEPRAIALLHRAIRLAAPGGVVVVADYPRPDGATGDRTAACRRARHELLLALTCFAATGGTGITVAGLRRWAGDAGADLVAELEPVPRQHVFLIRSRPEGSRP